MTHSVAHWLKKEARRIAPLADAMLTSTLATKSWQREVVQAEINRLRAESKANKTGKS